MKMKRCRAGTAYAALLTVAVVSLAVAASASAKLTGAFTVFAQCPYTQEETNRCIYSVTEGGEIVLGSKTVPIVNPVTLQGGYTEAVGGFSKLIPATNGVTLSKTPQPVPGGLLGLVPPEESPPLVKEAFKFFFENGLTGVNSTLELAKPANEVLISELHLAEEEGIALKLPVKIHLENPALGSNCYVGSSSSPIIWELTTATTSPPPPNEPITGSAGAFEFLEEGRIAKTKGAELVDNSWSAPSASGCGGFLLELLVDPIINSQIELPAPAGKNTAILENTITVSPALAVRKNDEANP